MREFSVYCVECECGAHIESRERETVCERCGRMLVFEWGAEAVVVVGKELE